MTTDVKLHGYGHMTLSVDRGCLVLDLKKITEHQVRIIPIIKIQCLEVMPPTNDHRGYLYFRTPVANKPIKHSVTGRDTAADDDMIFFEDEKGYMAALAIKEYVMNFWAAAAPNMPT